MADRGFANQALLKWLKRNNWHFCIRVPNDTLVHGVHRWYACSVSQLRIIQGEAKMYHQIRLWEQGLETVNLAVAYPETVAEPCAVITDETPTLQTLCQYGFRFRIEELWRNPRLALSRTGYSIGLQERA